MRRLLPEIMEILTKRLSGDAFRVAAAGSRLETGVRNHIHEGVVRTLAADGDGARTIGASTHGDHSVLEGIDFQTYGRRHFRIGDIVSTPLVDFQGKTIGVNFPTGPSDAETSLWSRKERRASDYSYWEGRPVVNSETGEEDWEYRTSHPAPWYNDEIEGVSPIYCIAHGDLRTVSVNDGTGKLAVTGETYGRILSANEHFRRAIDENASSPVLQLSCQGGHPWGSVAESLARALHDSGINRDLYSPKSLVGIFIARGREYEYSEIGVDTTSSEGYPFRDEPFSFYPAPGPDVQRRSGHSE
ncbi:hypothetical protein [Nocardia amamiensis]|uniref:hypothetical protein n=1 Tax=Nocardia amamiensis TaxID=404578 RepID=UPI0012F4FAE9|nr:hypothetical protein [Nocardia amamiensis]